MVQPDIVMVTLENNSFNRCRSAGAWLEGTMAGGLVVAPDWNVWKQPGVVLYKERSEFYDKVTEAINLPEDERYKRWMLSYTHLRENRSVEKMNDLRKRVLKLVLSKKDPLVLDARAF
jgi:hypothetical protein